MQKITSDDDLREIQGLSKGYLANRNSKREVPVRDIVHILPLVSQCRGHSMRVTPAYPKYYISDRSGLAQLGIEGQDWDFGACCRERSEIFSTD